MARQRASSWREERGYFEWRPYVSVAERRREAEAEIARQKKKGVSLQPVRPEGRAIAQSFWGKAWCENLESYHDYENRLPRGRTYLRNGSVIDLRIEAGAVSARVQGSSLYKVNVEIRALSQDRWVAVKERCAGHIDSVVALLAGKLPDTVMKAVTCRETGLFPKPAEITLKCSCPDWANMCKHVAAALYGVGTRLDSEPDLLFKLRGVSSGELVQFAARDLDQAAAAAGEASELAGEDLGALFGIDLAPSNEAAEVPLRQGRAGGAAKVTRKVKTGAAKKSKKSPAKKGAKEPAKKRPPSAAARVVKAMAAKPKKRSAPKAKPSGKRTAAAKR